MDREALINDLIANGQWTEEDREWLAGLEDDQLSKIVPVGNEGVEEGEDASSEEGSQAKHKDGTTEEEVADEKQPVTNAADYLEKAPPEIKEVLEDALLTNAERRAELIAIITSNEKNVFTKEQLAAMRVSELKAVAALAQVPEDPKKETVLPSFLGLAPVFNTGGEAEEPLPLPMMTFEK